MIGIGLSLTKAAAVGGVGSLLAKLLRRAQAVARALGSPLLYVPDDYLRVGPDVKGSMASGWGSADARFTYAEGSVSWNGAAGANTSTTKVYLPVSYYNKLVKLEFTVTGYSGSGNGGIDSGALSTLPNDAAGAGAIDTRVAANGSYTFVGYWRGGGATDGRTLPILGRGTNGFTLTINSVQEILSASDYQDSAGTLPAYLGSTVGLLTDRAFNGELGDDLSGTLYANNASVTYSGGVATFTNSAVGHGIATALGSLELNKSYQMTFRVVSLSAGTLRPYAGSTGAGPTISAPGSYTVTLQTSGTTQAIIIALSAGTNAVVDSVQIRELKGNHATQATAGARPLLARSPRKTKGPTNLLTYSQDFSNAAWIKDEMGAASATVGFKLTPSVVASTGHRVRQNGTFAAAPYTLCAMVKADGYDRVKIRAGAAYVNFSLVAGSVGNNANALGYSSQHISDGWYLFTLTTSVGGSVIYLYADTADSVGLDTGSFAGNGTDGILVQRIGLFQGTYTAQQILDNGGIPPTTSVALPNVLEWNPDEAYDGSNDFEQLAVNPIGSNLSQPYTIVVSGVVGAIGAARWMCGDMARGVMLSTGGDLYCSHGAVYMYCGKSFVAGDKFVVEFTWDGAVGNAWVNGVKTANNVTFAAGVSAATAWMFGQRGDNTGFWNGKLDGRSVHGAVIPDAQRKTIAKAFAAKIGVTYAG